MNNHLSTLIIIPITSTIKNYPSRLSIKIKQKKGYLAFDQIYTIDKKRSAMMIEHANADTIREIKILLHTMLVA